MRTLLFLLLVATAAAAVDITKPLPTLKLTNGKTLAAVEFVSFSQSSAIAKWAGGRGTIAYDQLPADVLEAIKPKRPKPPSAEETAAAEKAAKERREAEAERARASKDAMVADAYRQKEINRLEDLVHEQKITVGMTEDQVTRSWGKPNSKNLSPGGAMDQWIYSSEYVYFRDGKVISWSLQR